MLTSAAPMPPMMAAALPPPGVGALEASSSRKVVTGLSLIIVMAQPTMVFAIA